MKKSVLYTVFSVFLLVLLASCSTTNPSNSTERTVSVSGSGTVNLRADMVTFTVTVSETKTTTAKAQKAANTKMSKVLEIIRSFGVTDDNISTSSLNYSTQYKWTDGEEVRIGEQVSQSVTVKLENIDVFGSLVDTLGTNVTGIALNRVNFEASDYTKAAEQARKLAYENAREKAMVYAVASGMVVGRPITINDGYDSYGSVRYTVSDAKMANFEAAAAAGPQTETPTGLLSVTVNTSVVFELFN